MTTTISETAQGLSSKSVFVRRHLRDRISSALRSLIPQPDSQTRGVWNEESIRVIMAIFEIQRVELHSELEEQRIHNSLIVDVMKEVATRSFFPDPRSDTLVLEMEAHLRLLAAALRIYSYHGKSLDH